MTLQHIPFHLDCPFREARSYVHSASLCNELTARFAPYDAMSLVLRNWMTSRVCFTPVDAPRPKSGSGHVTITRGDVTRSWELSEDTDMPVVRRDSYDEAALADPADVTEKTIHSEPKPGATVFDRLIAANKVLINKELNPGVKLIAAKVSLGRFLPNDAPFDLELASHMGTRIFKSRILSNGTSCGELVFYGE
ncbi:hypothetical protein AB9K34_04750 [Sedimentitalea sp. XS_ASV28]|uniref:hypothetical protein n=1 Tax=Sedimentitalea sp. XS_ASV28 TaxID=3241296 RepID=UPI003514EBDD